MAEPATAADTREAFRQLARIGGVVAIILLLLALALWAKYGGTLFVEMISTVWAYCF